MRWELGGGLERGSRLMRAGIGNEIDPVEFLMNVLRE